MKDNKKTVAAIAASLLERQMKTYERVQRFLHSRFMRYLVFLAIIGSVMSVILGSFEGLSTYHGLLYSVTYITSLIFFIEYVLQIYAAPAENIQSFLEGRGQLNIGRVQPTYDRGVAAADLGALLPQELAETLRAGLRAYERKIAGYTAPEAILTGLETRTSSPVRLKREENFECTQLAGLYPCGEGAGYAGGIMSAAVDGLRVARAIISRYAPAEG